MLDVITVGQSKTREERYVHKTGASAYNLYEYLYINNDFSVISQYAYGLKSV